MHVHVTRAFSAQRQSSHTPGPATCPADAVLKATKVDGVYSADPVRDPSAELYERLGYDRVIESKLGVMDANAIVLCRDQKMPIRVFNVFGSGNLMNIVKGQNVGTIIS